MPHLAIQKRHFVIGRLVNEDEKFMLLEIAKDDDEPYTLRKGDRFYSLLFTRITDGDVESWRPWEDESLQG